MITDDVAYNRDLVISYLEGYNFKLIEAQNGKDAVEKAILNHPDLILMDLRMPIMNGYDAAIAIKADESISQIPVIAFTASIMQSEEDEVKRNFDGYIRKPIQKYELVNELKRHLKYSEETIQDVNSEVQEEAASELILPKIAEKEFSENLCKKIEDAVLLMNPAILKSLLEEIQVFADKYELSILTASAKQMLQDLDNYDFEALEAKLTTIMMIKIEE